MAPGWRWGQSWCPGDTGSGVGTILPRWHQDGDGDSPGAQVTLGQVWGQPCPGGTRVEMGTVLPRWHRGGHGDSPAAPVTLGQVWGQTCSLLSPSWAQGPSPFPECPQAECGGGRSKCPPAGHRDNPPCGAGPQCPPCPPRPHVGHVPTVLMWGRSPVSPLSPCGSDPIVPIPSGTSPWCPHV